MWIVEASITLTCRPEDIWKLWEDVVHWPTWDHGLDYCSLKGPFVAGTTGKLKPKNAPTFSFKLTHVEENTTFRDTTFLPFTRITFIHSMSKRSNSELTVTHRAEVSGLLSPFLWFTLRRSLKTEMPESLKNLGALAEKSYASWQKTSLH